MSRPKSPATRPVSKDQTTRFIETARALGCDENEATFKAKLAVIGRQKPKEPPSLDTLPKPKKDQ